MHALLSCYQWRSIKHAWEYQACMLPGGGVACGLALSSFSCWKKSWRADCLFFIPPLRCIARLRVPCTVWRLCVFWVGDGDGDQASRLQTCRKFVICSNETRHRASRKNNILVGLHDIVYKMEIYIILSGGIQFLHPSNATLTPHPASAGVDHERDRSSRGRRVRRYAPGVILRASRLTLRFFC